MNNILRNMKSTPKRLLGTGLLTVGALLLLFIVTAAGNGFPVKTNPFITKLKSKLSAFDKHLPEDRVYLQFDKPFYKPGDDIWFGAFVRDAKTMKRSTKSDILYVDLINPKGNVQQKIKLVAYDGFTKGDFKLDQDVLGGIYKVKAYTKWQENSKKGFVFEKEIQIQKVVLPNLKMKLDFDRKAVGAGDQVVASLDLQNNDNTPLANHAFEGKVKIGGEAFKTIKGKTDALGKAKVKFQLPTPLETNDGLLNILIAYNGLTESISRSVPIVLNKIDLEFFPEGGDLVYGQASKLAFRAMNEFGKPADIEGVVLDQNDAEIANFKSFHQGMGAFKFNPADGQTFRAKITKPEGITEVFELPEPMERGFVLNVDHVDAKEMAVVIRTTESEPVSLVAQVRGEVYWASEVTLLPGKTEVSIPISKFPMGVCQLTLFDAKGIERCERLAFVNRDRQLNIAIKTNKEKYLPREKVKMSIKVTDERGMPMPAQLSMAVVNDQMLSFADDKSGTILSQLLLEPDLKQKVDEPRFYFDKKEEKSIAALDFLMLTSGWRRFTWEQALSDQLPAITNNGERAQVAGVVMDAYTGKPIPSASISAPGSNIAQLADNKGRFTLDQLDLGKDKNLIVSASKYGQANQAIVDYGENTIVYLYPKNVRNQFDVVEDEEVMDDMDIDMAGGAEPMVQEMAVMAAPRPRPMYAKGNQNVRAMRNKDVANAPKKRMKAATKTPAPIAKPAVAENMKNEIAMKEVINLEDGIEPQPLPVDNHPVAGPIGNLQERDEFEVASGKAAEEKVGDMRAGFLMAQDREAELLAKQKAKYYRAREFAAPVYGGVGYVKPNKRSDFRETVYWNPQIKVNRSGRAVLEFYNTDEISSFRAIAEGISVDGQVGRGEKLFYTQLPFSMKARVPVEVASGDDLVVPVVLKNNTTSPLSGSLHVMPPNGLEQLASTSSVITIPAGMAQTVHLAYKVKHQPGEGVFNIAFAGAGHTDAFEQKLKIVPAGFPVALSFAGRETSETYKFKIGETVPGSITANFSAFPSVVTDLVKGIESILREPHGCFEQTSTSSYPNAMVMSYMLEQEEVDPAIMKRAKGLLDKGYKRLTTFETKEKGYEWFGSSPGHEALTAYGLMQFNDYSKVTKEVDPAMVDRTGKWLLSRRDGKGGFKKNTRALDQFGRADDGVTNAYIVYALSEANTEGIDQEVNAAYDQAMKDKDPYQLACVANALFNIDNNAKGMTAVNAMLATQKADGSFVGTKSSITRSGGQSLMVETTALATLAMLKSGKASPKALEDAVQSIVKARSGSGGFGSTQGTILGLKALVEYSKFSKKTDEAGIIEIYVDGKKVAEQAYEAGRREEIQIKGLESYLSSGVHTMSVKYKGVKNALPYSVAIDYHTPMPNSAPECVLDLKTKLSTKKTSMGETVRLTATLSNTSKEGQPMSMAIIGIPAGLSAQPWQLKELQEKKVVDFYEITGNNVVCYYRQMTPKEVRVINLDLKADIPGVYTASASSAYLYYTAEHKTWVGLPSVTITN